MTHTDWDGELYKTACHIHAESMAYKVGMAGADDFEMAIYKRLKILLADARREERKELLEKVEVGIGRWYTEQPAGVFNIRMSLPDFMRLLATLKKGGDES